MTFPVTPPPHPHLLLTLKATITHFFLKLMTQPKEPISVSNVPGPVSVYVPQTWCQPTYQPGELVWHACHQYEVTGVAPNHFWQYWSYTVLPVGHSRTPDYIENIQGYLLEHQLGRERPLYCDEQETTALHEQGSPSYSDASGVRN